MSSSSKTGNIQTQEQKNNQRSKWAKNEFTAGRWKSHWQNQCCLIRLHTSWFQTSTEPPDNLLILSVCMWEAPDSNRSLSCQPLVRTQNKLQMSPCENPVRKCEDLPQMCVCCVSYRNTHIVQLEHDSTFLFTLCEKTGGAGITRLDS